MAGVAPHFLPSNLKGLVEALQHLLNAEGPRVTYRQFDHERHSITPGAQLSHSTGVARCELKLLLERRL
jgi:hypothetical protein